VALRNIGLVKDHGGHLVNQPRLSLFEKCCKTTVGHQRGTVIKTNKHRAWWSKFTDERACLRTQTAREQTWQSRASCSGLTQLLRSWEPLPCVRQ